MTIHQTFWKSVDRPENKNADGSVNWSYVDADIWLENTARCERMGMEVYGDWFCEQVERYNELYGIVGAFKKVELH